MNPYAALQFLQLLATLLTLSVSSGNTTTIQNAITQASEGIAYVQESGAIDPVTPVYYASETSTVPIANSTPVLGSTDAPQSTPTSTPEVWTCKLVNPPMGWAMVDQNGVINTSTYTDVIGFTLQRLQAMGRTPCNWQ